MTKHNQRDGRWQPIETAPKDGTAIICGSSYWRVPIVMYWRKRTSFWGGDLQEFWAKHTDGKRHLIDYGMCELASDPTHWMPIKMPRSS